MYRSDVLIPIDQKFSWSSSNINERVKGRKPRISVTDASDHDDTRLHLDIDSAAKMTNTSSSSSSTTTSRSGSITDPGAAGNRNRESSTAAAAAVFTS